MNQSTEGHGPRSSMYMEERWKWLAPLALLVLGMAFVPLSHVDYLHGIPGNMGDARFNGIVLEHFYRWLTGRDGSLLSPAYFYPMPGTLTFSDNHWGTAWIYSGFRLLGFDRYTSFDLWYLTGYLLNFVCAHVVMRKLGFSHVASACGAFVFAFSMVVGERHGHAQLTYRFLMPVALLMWLRFTRNPTPKWLGYCAVAVAGQFYISIYLGYFLLLLLAAWAIAECILERGWPWRWAAPAFNAARGDLRDTAVAAAMLAISLAALVLLLYPYIHYSHFYGFERHGEEIFSMLPRPASYLLADGSRLWDSASAHVSPDIPMRHEQQMFMGLGVTTLALLGVWKGGRLARQAGLSFLLIALFTLCIGGFSLYMYVSGVPGINSIRAVARIVLALILPVSIASASAIDFLRKGGKLTGYILGFALMAIVLDEAAAVKPYFYLVTDAKERAAMVRAGFPGKIPSDAILYVPVITSEPFYMTELDGMLAAQELGVKTLNGYSGNAPPGYGDAPTTPACQQANGRIQAATSFLGGRHIQVPPNMAHPDLLVDREAACTIDDSREIPPGEMGKVRLSVLSIDRNPTGEWRLKLRIDNESGYSLQAAPSVHPVRVSWQFHPLGSNPDPSKWSARGEITGGDIGAGQTRELTIPVSDSSEIGQNLLSVSLVSEGRAWFHEHGLTPVTVSREARKNKIHD